MAVAHRIVERIEDAANAWLPEPYTMQTIVVADFGQHENWRGVGDSTPVDEAERARNAALVLGEVRGELVRRIGNGQTWLQDDLDAWPASGEFIIVEISHGAEPYVSVYRCYSWATVEGIITDPDRTPAQKRNAIRGAVQNQYEACQARVEAASQP